jgi:hypothetical protein
MTPTISKLALIALACTASAFSATASGIERGDQGAGAAFFVSTDNEDFSTRRIAAEYLPRFRHGDALTGVRYTSHYFEQNAWSRRGHQLSLMHRNVDTATVTGWQLEGGIFQQNSHDLLTLDGSWRKLLAERTGLELMISRDWVETANALDEGIHYTFAGAALDQGIGQHVTVIGLLGRQEFSDDNFRNHARIRFIVQPDLDLGLTLQARYRAFRSGRDDVNGAYFNPENFHEALFAVGWRQRIEGWTLSSIAGTGRQKVSNSPHRPSHLLEIGLQSPASRAYSLRLRGGVSQSASFNGPDYRFRYLQAELIIGF